MDSLELAFSHPDVSKSNFPYWTLYKELFPLNNFLNFFTHRITAVVEFLNYKQMKLCLYYLINSDMFDQTLIILILVKIRPQKMSFVSL